MNKLDLDYQNLLKDILENGVKKETRNGGTISVFGRQIRHNMQDGFPVLTTKKMAWKTMVTELLWFLHGDTNIKFLLENDCNIWTGDAYKNYSDQVQAWEPHLDEKMFVDRIKTDDEFAEKWGELGPVYGRQWRSWSAGVLEDKHGMGNIDQITNLINDLKTNPDSRRLMVNAWNVGELDQMVLPPCHYGFQVYTRELTIEERLNLASKTYKVFEPFDFNEVTHEEINKLYPVPKRAISLMWNQRSVDTFLGLPFNIASYGLLLTILAKEVNMVPDQLIGNLGDTHLYLNHIEQAKEQIGREPFELPRLNQFPTYEGSRPSIESYVVGDFTLKDYQSHPSIKAPLSN
jgi:thymidylate synthase